MVQIRSARNAIKLIDGHIDGFVDPLAVQRVRDELFKSLDTDSLRLLQREWMIGRFHFDEGSQAVASYVRKSLQVDRVRIEREG